MISVEQLSNIINKLDPNKAHRHDKIGIRMFKLCWDPINKPLATISKKYFKENILTNNWKKANVVPIYKKHDKQIATNYRPVSLLLVCSKIFKRTICNTMYKYISDNNLLSPNQSDFYTRDSCINQL